MKLCLLPMFAAAASASAQTYGRPAALREVGIDQKLNGQLPLDTMLTDDGGRAVRLGEYFKSKPVVLALVYYQCPMLCNQVLTGLLRSLRKISLDAGSDFEVVAVSIDSRETPSMAAAKKRTFVEKYDRESGERGWHFLTGSDTAVRAIADTAGFHYAFDPLTNQFAHAAGVMVATRDGRLARYFYGIEYPERDLRLGLVEASNRQIGSLADQMLLFCYHYDPANGKYGLVIMNVIRALGSATILALGALIFTMVRADRRQRSA